MDNNLRFRLLFLVALMTSKLEINGVMALNEVWIRDVMKEGNVFHDNVTFLSQTQSEIGCARACVRKTPSCVMIKYSPDDYECQGYSGTFNQQMEGTVDRTLWKRTNMTSLQSKVPVTVPNEAVTCALPGYTFHHTFQSCIRLYKTKVNRQTAEMMCQNDMANLIIVDSMEKIEAFNTALQERGWVGLYDYNPSLPGRDFRWSNGNTLSVRSPLWGSGEPNNINERCGNIHTDRLNDDGCYIFLSFGCQEIKYHDLS